MSARHPVSQAGRPTRPDLRRPAVALAVAAVVAVLTTALAACGTFVTASTSAIENPANGTSADTGRLGVRNLLAVSGQNGVATLTATIINNGDAGDSLTAVVSPAGTATLMPSAISLPGHSTVRIGAPSTGSTSTGPAITALPPTVRLTGRAIEAGRTIGVTLRFANSPQVTLTALVMPNSGDFSAVPVPTSTPSVAAG